MDNLKLRDFLPRIIKTQLFQFFVNGLFSDTCSHEDIEEFVFVNFYESAYKLGSPVAYYISDLLDFDIKAIGSINRDHLLIILKENDDFLPFPEVQHDS